MERAIESACKRLGYSKLKEEQLRSVVDVLSGRDAFVSFPTGYGKSLCYAILPWAFDEVRSIDKKALCRGGFRGGVQGVRTPPFLYEE